MTPDAVHEESPQQKVSAEPEWGGERHEDARSCASKQSERTSASKREERARNSFRSPLSGKNNRQSRYDERERDERHYDRHERRDKGDYEEDHDETNENDIPEIFEEKEALLSELRMLAKQGLATLSREFSMKDSLRSLQFEYDRIQSESSATQTVEMVKGGIRMGVGLIEMMLKKQGMESMDGWYNNACGDMSKYNPPLHKLYKKYWRKVPNSPMMELAFLIFGSAVWTVVQNKMGGKKQAEHKSEQAFGGGNGGAQGGSHGATSAASHSNTAARPMRPPQHTGIRVGASWAEAAAASEPPASDIAAAAAAAETAEHASSTTLRALHEQQLATQALKEQQEAATRALSQKQEETSRALANNQQKLADLAAQMFEQNKLMLETMARLEVASRAKTRAKRDSELSEDAEEAADEEEGSEREVTRTIALEPTPATSRRGTASRKSKTKAVTVIRVGGSA
jgi:hypothetical protein